MGRDTVQLETAVTTISQEYLLEFTLKYGISEALHLKLPGPEDMIVDFPKGKARPRVDVFQQEAKEKYPAMLYQAFRFSKKLEQLLHLGGREGVPNYCGLAYECSERRMPAENTYSPEAVIILNTHRTPIQKQPEALLCLVGLSRIYYLGDEVYPTFLHDDDRDMDLFSLIRAPNPTKVKIGSRPHAAHEVSLLTVTANRVIEMEDPATVTDSSGEATVPEVSPPENVTTTRVALEAGQAERVAATSPPVVKERRKRGHDGVDTNAPPKVLRRDHADPRPTESTREGKSLATIELGMGSTRPAPASQGASVDVSDPDLLSFAGPQSRPSADIFQGAAAAGDPDSENTSFASMVGSPKSIYRPEWGTTNGSLLDAPEACQDLVDHIAPPGYFLELRHLHNEDFLKQYNVNLARQVAMGSHLRLRFEQKAKLLKKSVAQVARRDKRIQARENEIKNLETLLEAEIDMKNAAENKTVSTLQDHVSGKEKLKAAFEEFKQYEDNRVEQRCAEMDARLDALSIDFDEDLYPHMLTAIAGYRWMIERGLRLAVMKCGESTELRQAFADVMSAGIAKGMSEGLKHGVEHGQAKLDLEAIEVYDPEAEAKYIAALHALKNLKYHLVDQLESLKDAPMDVIMASLHLEKVGVSKWTVRPDRTGKPDRPDRTERISVRFEVLYQFGLRSGRSGSVWSDHTKNPKIMPCRTGPKTDPDRTVPFRSGPRSGVLDQLGLGPDPVWSWPVRSGLRPMLTPTRSRAEKKKKCRVVCRTHGVGFAHHARSDGVSVSVPTVAPQGLAILLADAATQTETSDEASPRLLSLHQQCLVCSVGVFAHTQHLGRMTLRTQSPRPLGLQPVYAVGRV
nr:transposase (putative), gypsy type [Tanacetum cinerariifolium]